MRSVFLSSFLFLLSCGQVNKEKAATDSDSIATDSVTSTVITQQVPADPEPSPPVDSSDVATMVDRQREIAVAEEAKYYVVTVMTRQYEGSSSVTWHFDNKISPRYFSQSWSMEGNEGSVELMAKDGSVICKYESESNYEIKWCEQSGGIKTTWPEEGGDPVSEQLDGDMTGEYDRELTANLTTLKQILGEGKITEEGSDSYTIRIEQTVDVGQEVTESVEVDIPKAVYDFFMK